MLSMLKCIIMLVCYTTCQHKALYVQIMLRFHHKFFFVSPLNVMFLCHIFMLGYYNSILGCILLQAKKINWFC